MKTQTPTTSASTKTIRQLAGETTMRSNSDQVRQLFAADKAGDTKAAKAIYDSLPEGLRRGVDNSRNARDGKLDPKSAVQVEATRSLFGSVKSADIDGVISAFGRFSQKARPGVLKTLASMVSSGRVTPAMAEAIGGLKA